MTTNTLMGYDLFKEDLVVMKNYRFFSRLNWLWAHTQACAGVHVHTHTRTYTFIHVIHTFLPTRINAYLYTQMHTYTHNAYTNTYIYLPACIRTHIHYLPMYVRIVYPNNRLYSQYKGCQYGGRGLVFYIDSNIKRVLFSSIPKETLVGFELRL